MFKHDVDYNVKSYNDKDMLTFKIDDARLSGLANLEELHQVIVKNTELASNVFKNVPEILSKLESIIETLRKEI